VKSLDDLLIERRRGTLSATEAAELEQALGEYPELKLSLSAGEAFDRLDTDLPGDGALLERIVNGAARTPRSSPWIKLRWLLVLPLLSVVGSNAWFIARAPEHAATPAIASATASARGLPGEQPTETPASSEARFEFEPQKAAPAASMPHVGAKDAPVGVASAASQFEFEPRSAAPIPSTRSAPDRAESPATRTRTRSEAARRQQPPAPATIVNEPATSTRDSERERAPSPLPPVSGNSRELENLRALSARELFERGNQARAHDWLEAETLYTLLLDSYPASREAAVAELTLGKRALAVGRAEDALRWFRRHQQRAGNTLRAEAAWGECQALEQLQRRSELVAAWQQLIERYPETSYAAVARRRLEALE